MRPPSARTCRISAAILEIRSFLGFSAETSLAMKVKISVWRDRLHPAEGGVVLMLADPQLLDVEVAAQVHDQVHDLGQDHGVDDVTLQYQESAVPELGAHTAAKTELIASFRSRAAAAGSSA